MKPTLNIHEMSAYDFEERKRGFWEGYTVQFSKEEWEAFKDVDGVEMISDGKFSVIVTFKPKKEEWEDLFK